MRLPITVSIVDLSVRARQLLHWQTNENADTFVQLSDAMKYALPLLAALFVSACDSVDEPPQRVQHRVAKYPPEGQPPPAYPPQQQPFNPNGQPAQTETTTTTTENSPSGPAASAGATTKSKGDYPYGIPVPGKPHLVESPYSPGKFVDVEGFGPGQEVKDPYTGKIFLVP